MLEKVLKEIAENISSEQFGGKAFWLKWLGDNGFPIPKSYFSKAEEPSFYTPAYYEKLWDEIKKLFQSGERIALRSSGIQEDGEKESKAGKYKSFLQIEPSDFSSICESHKEIIRNASKQGDRTGVIFQQMIDAAYSGVMFTSNYDSFSKKELIIHYCNGTGDALVSGASKEIEKITVQKDNPKFQDETIGTYLLPLAKMGIEIENKLNKPMDVEWCVERNTGKIFILQCRPITSIFLEKDEIKKVTAQSIGDDERLKSLDKVKIRLMAESHDVLISDAYIVNCNCITDDFPFDSIELNRSRFCKGYNVVVITPKTIDEKIVRHFVGKKSDAMRSITCNRYRFRMFPKFENLHEALHSIYKQVKSCSWICTMIIQEIFDPKFTGIIKAGKDAVFIEIARGHFVAKGIVPMSLYTMKENGIHSHEAEQDKYYRILEGHQIEQNIDKQIIHIAEADLRNIEKQFVPVLKEIGCNLEFGLLDYDGNLEPYLIDFTEDNSEETMSSTDVEAGIISHGNICGKLVKIERADIQQSLNAHCQNTIENIAVSCEPVIFLCELPDIKLMEKLNSQNIGFVFKGGSQLCHLSILLRERHIPALIYGDAESLEIGAVYKLDTRQKKKLIRIVDEK